MIFEIFGKKEIQIDTSHGPLGCKITKLETSLTDSLKLRMMTIQGQLTWAGSGFEKWQRLQVRAVGALLIFSYLFICATRKLQFRWVVIGRFKTSRANQMFPAEFGFPTKVSCASSGLYYLCFKHSWMYQTKISFFLLIGNLPVYTNGRWSFLSLLCAKIPI